MNFKEILRTTLINNSQIYAKVQDRVYPGFLATIPNPIYPCMNFAFIMGGSVDKDVKEISDEGFRVWVWSTNSYDEAREIYKLIFDSLHQIMFRNSEVKVLFEETGRPIENFDEIERTYYLVGTWRTRILS